MTYHIVMTYYTDIMIYCNYDGYIIIIIMMMIGSLLCLPSGKVT